MSTRYTITAHNWRTHCTSRFIALQLARSLAGAHGEAQVTQGKRVIANAKREPNASITIKYEATR